MIAVCCPEVAHATDAIRGLHALSHLGEVLAGLDVVGVLVHQAALEAAALARHLRRIENQPLVLRHLDGDRHEGG